MVLLFNADGKFLQRLDAPAAQLIPGQQWDLRDVTLSRTNQTPQIAPAARFPTDLTPDKIEEQYTKPDAVSFWSMPNLIETIRRTGLTVTRLELQYFSLLSEPLLFMGLALLSVAFALRHQRSGGAIRLIVIGKVINFVSPAGESLRSYPLRRLQRECGCAVGIPCSV